jgi:hypothetical protein
VLATASLRSTANRALAMQSAPTSTFFTAFKPLAVLQPPQSKTEVAHSSVRKLKVKFIFFSAAGTKFDRSKRLKNICYHRPELDAAERRASTSRLWPTSWSRFTCTDETRRARGKKGGLCNLLAPHATGASIDGALCGSTMVRGRTCPASNTTSSVKRSAKRASCIVRTGTCTSRGGAGRAQSARRSRARWPAPSRR